MKYVHISYIHIYLFIFKTPVKFFHDLADQVAMQRVKSVVSWRLNGVISKPKLFLCLHVLGRFDKLPHRLVPFFASKSRCQPCDPNTFPWLAICAWLRVIIRKNILQLAEAIRSKSTSRGCGPVLWKWALRQKFSRLIHLMLAHQFNIFRSQFYMAISSNDFQHCKDKLCQHHLWFLAEDWNVVAPTCKSILYSGMAIPCEPRIPLTVEA